MARAARESRQQARTIAYALARPLRGLAGRFELGAFRSIFLQVLLGEPGYRSARARPFEVGASRSLSFSFSRCMR